MRNNENIYGSAYNQGAYSVILGGETPAKLHLDMPVCLRGISYFPAREGVCGKFVIDCAGTYLVSFSVNGVPSSYGTYSVSVQREPCDAPESSALPCGNVSGSARVGGETVLLAGTFLTALREGDGIWLELSLPYSAHFRAEEQAVRLTLLRIGL